MLRPSSIFWGLVAYILFLTGCTSPGPQATATRIIVSSTPAPLFTLVPTYTPLPEYASLFSSPTPPPPLPTIPTTPTKTPIPLDETGVELRYTIPVLGIDRRLEGKVGGQIILVDESSGVAIQRDRQGAILLELQQSLTNMVLEPLPDGCDSCVKVTYSLPFNNLSGSGWLKDPVLLASIENYMSVTLGTYFPPDTVVGLRRSASVYAPAQTAVLRADGRLWVWSATDAEIPAPLEPETVGTDFNALLADVPLNTLKTEYRVACAGVPVETLWLQQAEITKKITITCPEFALPTSLLPLYAGLDTVLQNALAGTDNPAKPAGALPLDALLDYRRADGSRLTLYADGSATVSNSDQLLYTTILSGTQISDLTTALLDSHLLQPGLTTFITPEAPTPDASPEAATATAMPISRLLVRGPNGVYDAAWPTAVLAADIATVRFSDLNSLLDTLLLQLQPPATETPTPEP